MSQLPLPGIAPGAPKSRTRHRFGLPSGQYAEAVCKSCPVRRRFGPFGAKQGYCFQWKRPDEEWTTAEIACVTKVRKR